MRNKCKDPCPGTCGQNAEYSVINHIPMCTCIQGYTGSAFILCSPIPVEIKKNPCNPSPCGPNSQCREINGQAVCSCVPGFIGSPPTCQPECVTSSECNLNQACVNQKCINTCTGTCGVGANCQVVNHNPICSCPARFTGDPFVRCLLIPEDVPPPIPINPCNLSPCGPNAQCKVIGESPSCSCLPDFQGSPPNCRPESIPVQDFTSPSPCGANAQCREQNGAGACSCLQDYIGNPYVLYNKACIKNKCQDPCPGTCGQNANCQVVSHLPSCTFCLPGYTGDPFRYCNLPPPEPVKLEEPSNPCQPSPCGPNSQCREVNGQAVCSCLPT